MITALVAIIIGAIVGVVFAAQGKLSMEALPAGVLGAIGGLVGGWIVKSILMWIPFGMTILFAGAGAVLAVMLFSLVNPR